MRQLSLLLALILMAVSSAAAQLCGTGIVCNPRFFAPMSSEPSRAMAFSDRKIYFANDPVAHIVVTFVGQTGLSNPNRGIDITTLDPSGAVIPLRRFAAVEITQPDFEFFLDLQRLFFGNITITATLIDASSGAILATTTVSFRRDTRVEPTTTFNGSIPIVVGPQSVLLGGRWPISTGIPLPEGALLDPRSIGLFENGVRIPAQITTRGSWRPLGGTVKWLGLDFTAAYDGTVPRTYALQRVPSGSIPPTTPLTVVQTDTEISVN